MLGKAASMALWLARGAAIFWGAAFTLALVLGVATVALAALPGDPFKLGRVNSIDAMSTLVGDLNDPMLRIENNGTGTALDLHVRQGKQPLKVDSSQRVVNLNADRVDGRSFRCPSGTLYHEGVCIETSKRAATDYTAAEAICLGEGRRLPSVAELQTFRNRPGNDFDVGEMSNALFMTENATYVTLVSGTFGNVGFLTWNHELNYRCVVPAS